jgi:hypothetical protein
MTSLFTAQAVHLLAVADKLRPEVVSRPGARTLHLQRTDGHVRDDFTARGALHRSQRPLCGQQSRRWYRTAIDGRPLCRRCARVVQRATACVAPTAVCLPVEDLATALDAARSADDVSAVVLVALATPGLITRPVQTDDGPLPLMRLIRRARLRVSRPPVVEQRDHNWASRLKTSPASRYPRRFR